MSTTPTVLCWPDRFKLIAHYSLNLDEICIAFGCTTRDFKIASDLLHRNVFWVNEDLNVGIYSQYFTRLRNNELGSTPTPVKAPRAPRSSKIEDAFAAITTERKPITYFTDTFGISAAVLRQGRRFDRTGGGRICIRKNKEDGLMYVWRDSAEAASE